MHTHQFFAIEAFAACMDDQPITPFLRDMDLPSQHLLHGESVSLWVKIPLYKNSCQGQRSRSNITRI